MRENMEELMPIWVWLCEKYTSKESSSVSYERGQMLMEAVLFCIEAGRKGKEKTYFQNDKVKCEELSVENTNQEPLRKIYDRGYQILFDQTVETKKQYDHLIQRFDSYGNQNLYDTVIKGLPQFFLRYNIRFEPENILLTLDYPVLYSLENIRGIYKIAAFIKAIAIEQEFLSCFSKLQLQKLLMFYDADYREGFFNLAEAAAHSLLFQVWENESKNTNDNIQKTPEMAKKVLLLCDSRFERYLPYLENALEDIVFRWNVSKEIMQSEVSESIF